MKKHLACLSVLCLVLIGCDLDIGVTTPDPPDVVNNDNILFGVPSKYNTDIIENHYMEKPQYSLSYDRDRGTPNWVSWCVSTDWLGQVPHQDDFRADNSLPAGWYRVGGDSYRDSGFDRGQHAPSADRTKTVEDNSATFLMTNVIPQAPNHKLQIWAKLEEYTKSLVRAGNEVYVIMGSYGTGGEGSKGRMNTIDNGRVTVPSHIWKVILVLPKGINDMKRVTLDTRVIAVITPNVNSVSPSWSDYRTSVDAIEAASGFDLFPDIEDYYLRDVLEAKIDTGPTQ